MSQRRRGTMATLRSARFAKQQLAGHWAGKGTVEQEDGVTLIRFDSGQVMSLTAEESVLGIEVTVPDGLDPQRFAAVVAEHLVRFGRRDELVVVWQEKAPQQA